MALNPWHAHVHFSARPACPKHCVALPDGTNTYDPVHFCTQPVCVSFSFSFWSTGLRMYCTHTHGLTTLPGGALVDVPDPDA